MAVGADKLALGKFIQDESPALGTGNFSDFLARDMVEVHRYGVQGALAVRAGFCFEGVQPCPEFDKMAGFRVTTAVVAPDAVASTAHELTLGDLLQHPLALVVGHFADVVPLFPLDVVVLHHVGRESAEAVQARSPGLHGINPLAEVPASFVEVAQHRGAVLRSPTLAGWLIPSLVGGPQSFVPEGDPVLVGIPPRLALDLLLWSSCEIAGVVPTAPLAPRVVRSILLELELSEGLGLCTQGAELHVSASR